ncbi:MAG: GNAT family N-acetyltransferase [Planctomycetota bacterium]
MRCRLAQTDDRAALERISRTIGILKAEEVAYVMSRFDERSTDGNVGRGVWSRWWVLDVGGDVLAVAMAEPEPLADRVMNLRFIAVDPAVQGRGYGSTLLRAVRSALSESRLWIVETEATDRFAGVRRWYEREGFLWSGEVPDFYAEGVGKTVFWQRLDTDTSETSR